MQEVKPATGVCPVKPATVGVYVNVVNDEILPRGRWGGAADVQVSTASQRENKYKVPKLSASTLMPDAHETP